MDRIVFSTFFRMVLHGIPHIAFAEKLLTSQFECDIFFTEHSMTSFFFVSQLQLKSSVLFLQPFFARYSLRKREEPFFMISIITACTNVNCLLHCRRLDRTKAMDAEEHGSVSSDLLSMIGRQRQAAEAHLPLQAITVCGCRGSAV